MARPLHLFHHAATLLKSRFVAYLSHKNMVSVTYFFYLIAQINIALNFQHNLKALLSLDMMVKEKKNTCNALLHLNSKFA